MSKQGAKEYFGANRGYAIIHAVYMDGKGSFYDIGARKWILKTPSTLLLTPCRQRIALLQCIFVRWTTSDEEDHTSTH